MAAASPPKLRLPPSPPLPVPRNFPFQPEAGIQTSILISESLVGRDVAETRQNAGRSLKLDPRAPGKGGGVPAGSVNSPAPTDCASVTVVCGIASDFRLSHVAAQRGTWASASRTLAWITYVFYSSVSSENRFAERFTSSR